MEVAKPIVPKTPPNKLPGDSYRLLPLLNKEITDYWSHLTLREFPAGVIDQESNWKITAKLKTHREFGCGLSQHTIAYNANGTVRFDALEETKRLDKSLAGWTWEDCYNETYQLRGAVLKLRSNERLCVKMFKDNVMVLFCTAGMYNGGQGSVAKRIRLCQSTPGCDPSIWVGHLSEMCPQSKVKEKGYGESFCEINSKYPGRVFARMPKFEGYLNK